MNEMSIRPERHAAVIPFPLPVAPEPFDRALAGLQRAMHEQRAAVTAWRAALADLARTMRELTTSMDRYRAALTDTGARVGALGREARRQGAVMDALIERSRIAGARG